MKQLNVDKILVLTPPGCQKSQESLWGKSVKVCSMYTDSRIGVHLQYLRCTWYMKSQFCGIYCVTSES
jgi:hypothetical protein